jgi:hypothetical protein
MIRTVLALAPLALASACSGGSTADNQADRLDNAAEQSTGEAATVLHDQADQIRRNGAVGIPGAPGSSVQQAMDKAGNTQASGNSSFLDKAPAGPAARPPTTPSGPKQPLKPAEPDK